MLGQAPVDVLQCQSCGVRAAQEDWMPPTIPLAPNRCMNCGERYNGQVCIGCGLTKEEDLQVHDELRQIIDPEGSFLQTAQKASAMGRRLLALKLATAGAFLLPPEQANISRALRVWLMAGIGMRAAAMEDSQTWIDQHPDPPGVAWAAFGQQLEQKNELDQAIIAYERALRKSPNEVSLRARRAGLLLQAKQFEPCFQELLLVFGTGANEQVMDHAMNIGAELVDYLQLEGENEAVERLISSLDKNIERNASLLAQRARLAAQEGDERAAKRDLKRARKLDPTLPIYETVERTLKNSSRGGWWRW